MKEVRYHADLRGKNPQWRHVQEARAEGEKAVPASPAGLTTPTGLLDHFSDADGTTTYTYDTVGHRTSTSRTSLAGLTQKAQYGYDLNGRLTSLVYPSGLLVNYTYTDGFVTGVLVNQQNLLGNIKWQANGQPLAWIWGNSQTWRRTGDAAGHTAGITTGDANKVYTYDNVGNITAITDSTRATLNQGFRYDSMDRLTNASVASGTAWNYTYDLDGNRITSGDAATPYTYGATSNHLTGIQSSPAVAFQYDTAGNQIARAGTTFAFDNAGRMIKSAESGTALGSYVYNAIGQRMQKTAAGVTTRFVYDEAGHLLGEYGSTGIAAQETVYLGDWPVATVRKNGAGTAIAYYVWPDHLGTPRQVTDATSQKVLWRWEGGPFGSNTPNQDPQSTGTPFFYNLRFPGQYWDNEISRMSNGFRDYDPSLGRYIESDPIGLGGGINTYGYGGGNPLFAYDQFGLDPDQGCVAAWTMGGAACGGVAGGATGGVVGGVVGGTAGGVGGAAVCTPFAPGVGTAACGAAGAATGASAGTSVGASVGSAGGGVLGGLLGHAIGGMVCSGNNSANSCEPCTPPQGTTCWQKDTGHLHKGLDPHWHTYQMNQNPNTCVCFWNKKKSVADTFPSEPAGMPPCSAYGF